MTNTDWIVMILTLVAIVSFGVYKSKHDKNIEGYFLGNRSMPWFIVLLGIMGTQASAITFISAPGQAYTDGMRFVQYYFGLPIAMIVICLVFIPIYQRLKVYTAYEFLENRFDKRTRLFTSFLFLLGRGLSTGISIYAPSIIFSSLLGWNIYLTIILMGGVLIIYTVAGGAKAVAYTQQIQVIIIMSGMGLAAYTAVNLLPEGITLIDALKTGGEAGKMNIISSGVTEDGFNWKDKYNIWSGIIGGFFLALSYFGTDQSQVGRYLVAKDEKASKLGLIMNGFVKVPMQFFILLIGVIVFAFFQYNKSPIYFNETVVEQAMTTEYAEKLTEVSKTYDLLQNKQQSLLLDVKINPDAQILANANLMQMQDTKKEYQAILTQAIPGAENSDTNYIFLYFLTKNLPIGLVGLLLAAIIMAAWGSIAAALNSLASSTLIDFHMRLAKPTSENMDKKNYKLGWQYTLLWGLFSVAVAMFATNMGSLIEAVNVLGSLFYGVILGIFLVAFFFKSVMGKAMFWAAVFGELIVVLVYALDVISFLWLNVIGALVVILLSIIAQSIVGNTKTSK